ncbi:hypothetical protein AA103196_0681 [Ameyamaea chiangmaiensis NBRC 103196]|nr:hypothetical protein AA103196_0681 [Ameyamaea chiangmaiensis NBRC 103196]
MDLKVSGHLMTLDSGLYCIFHAPGQAPDTTSGFPGLRLSNVPGHHDDGVTIATFNNEGWLGGNHSAALVRVTAATGQIMVTVYQSQDSQQNAPHLQVVRLNDAGTQAIPATAAPAQTAPRPAALTSAPPKAPSPASIPNPEIAAHIEKRGDVGFLLGEWVGVPGSQAWIEGFSIAPHDVVAPADVEYQAVLGKGWLSPWSPGGQFCGSRGMALPILGLRVRLTGEAAAQYVPVVEATFTDGSKAGPVDDSLTVEAESLAPLEAFRVRILPRAEAGKALAGEPASGTKTAAVTKRTSSKTTAKAKTDAEAPAAGTDAPPAGTPTKSAPAAPVKGRRKRPA